MTSDGRVCPHTFGVSWRSRPRLYSSASTPTHTHTHTPTHTHPISFYDPLSSTTRMNRLQGQGQGLVAKVTKHQASDSLERIHEKQLD